MSKPRLVRIAIMSDLHADRPENGVVESHLDIAMPEMNVSQHPIAALMQLVDEHELGADLLVCPGDLTHRAKPEPLQYAWASVHRVGSALQVGLTVGTAGNHDMDSRYTYNKHDAKGMLQAINPLFPLPEQVESDAYWARNFAVKVFPNLWLVVLNSAAYHGGAPTEIERGRVSEYTIERLKVRLLELSKSGPKEVGILLCHHHPERQSDIPVPDYEAMECGPDLLQLLGSGEFGRWLVIHGHKHSPRIAYATGGATSPILFSAGSLSAFLHPALQSRARNQFYLLELHLDEFQKFGLVGRGRSWDFVPGERWIEAGPASGLPASFGFGCRTDPALLATRVAALGRDPKQWSEVLAQVPDLAYLLPGDFRQLQDRLENGFSMRILWHRGEPSQIGPQ